MLARFALAALAALPLSIALTASNVASAQSTGAEATEAAAPPARSTPRAPQAAAPDEPVETPYERWIFTTELLGAFFGRYGAQAEAVLSPRDSVAAYGWYLVSETQGTAALFDLDADVTYDTRTRAGGVDVQYRRYVGGKPGAFGAFIAPGLELHDYVVETSASCTRDVGPCSPESVASHHQTFAYLGGSLDVGGQAILPGGFVLGGSMGVHYRTVVGGAYDDHAPQPWGWSLTHGPGLRPRLRFTIGWAF